MKYIYVILFIIIFNVNQVMGEKVLFKYNREYMQYSYDNLTVILGDIKEKSDLKKIFLNTVLKDFPYDGIEITITDKKKLYYMVTESEKGSLGEKKIINYMNQEKKSFFLDDYLVIGEDVNGSKPEIKYKLNQKEAPVIKKLFYGEEYLSDDEYRKICDKLKKLDVKLEKYYENQVVPNRRVEIVELVSKLGYVTEISILKNKMIYWEEEEDMLQDNEVYLQFKEIENEIMNHIHKF